MKFKTLSQLKRPEPLVFTLGTMPESILMAKYAMEKAFKISELVCLIHKESYEWYGFTLAAKKQPELVIDIGLPKNNSNMQDHVTLSTDKIAQFQESIPSGIIINGWIHSHGALQVRHFSRTDQENHLNVLDFVSARTRRPLCKREIPIEDLVLLPKGCFAESDLAKGSVTLITDGVINEAVILETVYGSFCYSIVIGNEGWHAQEIYYRERSILSGRATVWNKEAAIEFVDTGIDLTQQDVNTLKREVEEKIQPNLNPPPETMERL